MGGKKKITVKPLANSELASEPNHKGRYKKYPLYVRVTYDRSSTRFPVEGGEYWVTEKQVEEDRYEGKEAVERIKQIAERERERLETHGVKALPGRYKIYNYSILSALFFCLIRHVSLAMEDKLTVSQFKEWRNQKIGSFFDSFDELYPQLPRDLQILIDADKLVKKTDTRIKVYEWVLQYPGRDTLIEQLRNEPINLLSNIKLLDAAANDLIRKGITSAI
jgi:hypothetical protein